MRPMTTNFFFFVVKNDDDLEKINIDFENIFFKKKFNK